MAVRIEDLSEACAPPYPWDIIEVFPNDLADYGDWSAFVYTVGAAPKWDAWCPTRSVEGREGGPRLVAAVVIILTAGLRCGLVTRGDTVTVPLSIRDADGEWVCDADASWWIGDFVAADPHRGPMCTMMSSAPLVIPMRWSSPLGWPTATS